MATTVADADVEVLADVSKFARDLKRKLTPILKSAKQTVELVVERDQLQRSTRRAARGLTVPVDADTDPLERTIRRAGAESGRSFSESFRNALGFQAAVSAITAALSPLRFVLDGIKFSAFAAAIGSVVQALGQFLGAVAPAVGVLTAVPGILAVGAAAFATFAVALSGVGDAFKSALTGDAEEFEKAIKNLAPAAQNVARELRELAPALKDVRTEVQQAFFAQLEGQLQKVADVLLGPIQEGMVAVATASSLAGLQLSEFLQEADNVAFIVDLFDATRDSVEALTPALAPVLRGLRDIASVGVSFMPQLAAAVGDVAARFGTFLSAAVASGEALEWVENGVAVLSQLGSIASSVGGIFSSAFRAAGAAGGDVLGTLQQLVGSVDDFFASVAGQEALIGVFQALSAAGQQLGDIFVVAATQIGNLAPIIADILGALGPALQTALQAIGEGLTALGPSLVTVVEGIGEAFKAIAPTLAPLGRALGDIFEAIAPALPVIGQLVQLVGTNLAIAFTLIAKVAKPVIEALASGLAPVLPKLAAAAEQLVPVFTRFADVLGRELGKSLDEILPSLIDLLPQLITELVPAIQTLTETFIDLLPVMAPVITELAKAFLPLLPILIPILGDLATVLALVASMFIRWQAGLITIAALLSAAFGNVVTRDAVAALAAAFGLLSNALVFVVQTVTSVYSALTLIDWGFITQLVAGFAADVVAIFVSLPGRVLAAVSDLQGLLWGFLTSVFAAAVNIVAQGINNIVNLAATVTSRVLGALSSLYWSVYNTFASAFNAARDAVNNGINQILGSVRNFAGQFLGVFNSLIGAAYNSGASIAQSLVNGILSRLQAVRNAASSLASAARNFLPFSPAKEGPFSGKGAPEKSGEAIARDLAKGMRQSRGVLQTAAQMATEVVNAQFDDMIRRLVSGGGGFSGPSGFNIPQFGDGGLVSKPTLAVVGEKGPEAIVPVGRSASTVSNKSVTNTINVSMGSGDPDSVASMVVRRLMTAGV